MHNQWQIEDFSEGRINLKGGALTSYFGNFPPKLHEIELKKIGPRWGVIPSSAPWIRQ